MTAQLGDAQAASPELLRLLELKADGREFVEATRRFDLEQQKLIEWDLKLAGEHQDNGEPKLAVEKQEDAKRRVALIDEAWRQVLGEYPNDSRANTYYGELLYDYLGDSMGGVQLWLLAIHVDDKEGRGHNNLAIHYFHSGDYDKGLKHLGKALKEEPKNPDFLYNAAQLYLNHFPFIAEKYDISKQKLYEQAMKHSRDAAKYAPDDYEIVSDYATNFYAAEGFEVKVDWKQAAEAWRAARKIAKSEEDKFFTLLNEGRTWLRASDNKNAAAALTQALMIRPDSEAAKKLLDEANGQSPAPESETSGPASDAGAAAPSQ